MFYAFISREINLVFTSFEEVRRHSLICSSASFRKFYKIEQAYIYIQKHRYKQSNLINKDGVILYSPKSKWFFTVTLTKNIITLDCKDISGISVKLDDKYVKTSHFCYKKLIKDNSLVNQTEEVLNLFKYLKSFPIHFKTDNILLLSIIKDGTIKTGCANVTQLISELRQNRYTISLELLYTDKED